MEGGGVDMNEGQLDIENYSCHHGKEGGRESLVRKTGKGAKAFFGLEGRERQRRE